MPEEITAQIPKKLADFIDKLIEEGYFESRKDFARCSLEIIAQLYGLSKTSKSGKSLLDILVDNGKSIPSSESKLKPVEAAPVKTQTTAPVKLGSLTPIEYDLLDLFAGATFEFEDALHARYTMELMKVGKPPLPKDEFIKLLEGLVNKNKLERTEHNEKIVWKITDKY
ncbi:MAG: hypothetical protein FK733_08760 [Asgard group archaeon]|nr:hypothetical protein [Asgard group archaeon]